MPRGLSQKPFVVMPTQTQSDGVPALRPRKSPSYQPRSASVTAKAGLPGSGRTEAVSVSDSRNQPLEPDTRTWGRRYTKVPSGQTMLSKLAGTSRPR